MSLESDRLRPSPKLSLEELKARNAEKMNVMSESHMPIMVPVQEKQWDTMVSLLRQNVELQPELTEELRRMATKEDLSASLQAMKQAAVMEIKKTGEAMVIENKRLKAENENLLTEIWDQLSQDGRNREQFSKDLKAEVTSTTRQLREDTRHMIKDIKDRPMTKTAIILLWVLAGSALAYPWLSLLLYNWLLR